MSFLKEYLVAKKFKDEMLFFLNHRNGNHIDPDQVVFSIAWKMLDDLISEIGEDKAMRLAKRIEKREKAELKAMEQKLKEESAKQRVRFDEKSKKLIVAYQEQ